MKRNETLTWSVIHRDRPTYGKNQINICNRFEIKCGKLKCSKFKGRNYRKKSMKLNETCTWSVIHQDRLIYQKSDQSLQLFWNKVWKTKIVIVQGPQLLQKSMARNETLTWSVIHQDRLTYQKSDQYLQPFKNKILRELNKNSKSPTFLSLIKGINKWSLY